MSTGSTFLQIWRNDEARNALLSCLPKDELGSVRLICQDFSKRAAPYLFEAITINFKPSIFTKPARMAALDRLGHHVETLTFHIPHGPETFLPPLLDPTTGEEQIFVYEPISQSSRSSASSSSSTRHSSPSYGSWEMTDLLVKQYPPLFHAAANIPSFTRAFSALPNLTHLKIACPGQDPIQRNRRSTVDYALLSLRIAIERVRHLRKLDSLTLEHIHPGATLYLNPTMGIGALPDSLRRWKKIRNLTINMETAPAGHSRDHLKLLHSYLQLFSGTVECFKFHWLNSEPPSLSSCSNIAPSTPKSNITSTSTHPTTSLCPSPASSHNVESLKPADSDNMRGTVKGPSPIFLSSETSMQSPSPPLSCPRRCHIALRPLKFKRLTHLAVQNAGMDASQVSLFISSHRRTICEFEFEGCHLRTGTWDEALSPLTRITGNEKWKGEKAEEMMDVPLLLDSPIDEKMLAEDYFAKTVAGGEIEHELLSAKRYDPDAPKMELKKSPTFVKRRQKQQRQQQRQQLNQPIEEHPAFRDVGGRGSDGSGWQRATSKTRDMLFGREEHMRRFIRESIFSWR
ncbi:hypothetical protein MMC09_004635 [Bachmanniomyces sp. S44760]|nr:hypothetical protein [Bachmanniomyces sp. S44760]